MTNDKVSIIIPTKDRVESLKRVLPSYLEQKYLKEIIIVNDGSADGTELYITGLLHTTPLLRYIKNSVNKGTSASRNIGIAKAKGNYVFMGDDDVELAHDHISILLEHLKSNNADIIAGRLIYLKIDEKRSEALTSANSKAGQAVDLKTLVVDYSVNLKCDKQLPLSHAIMLISKRVLKEIKYDEHYKVNFWREESDFQLTAAEHGYRLFYCGHTVCFEVPKINDRGGCHSSNKLRYEYWVIRNTYRFIYKHKEYIKTTFGLNSVLLYIILFAMYRIKENILGLLIKVRHVVETK